MTYRITLSVTRTDKAFMHHNTPNHREALQLLDLYLTFKGISATMETVHHA